MLIPVATRSGKTLAGDDITFPHFLVYVLSGFHLGGSNSTLGIFVWGDIPPPPPLILTDDEVQLQDDFKNLY